MSKILVTGGAGFIGSHLVKRLLEGGDEVIVIDNLSRGNKLDRTILDSITLVKGDVREYATLREYAVGCDLIYHFAAVLGVDIVADNPIETMETEIIGMKNVVEAAIYHGVKKVLYASTSGVYGHSAIERSVTEDIQLDPKTSYSIAKRYNEIFLAAVYEEKRLEAVSLRFFNVYGPRQDSRMVIPRFFEQALMNDPITVYGSGDQTRDFTYVDDVVTASIKLAETVSGCEIFNIAYGRDITIMEIAEKIKNVTRSRSPIIKMEPPKKRYDFEVERRSGCSDKLCNAIDYKPTTTIEEGLAKVYEVYRPERTSSDNPAAKV
jgi:UDP-glucose 4-epimerase